MPDLSRGIGIFTRKVIDHNCFVLAQDSAWRSFQNLALTPCYWFIFLFIWFSTGKFEAANFLSKCDFLHQKKSSCIEDDGFEFPIIQNLGSLNNSAPNEQFLDTYEYSYFHFYYFLFICFCWLFKVAFPSFVQ